MIASQITRRKLLALIFAACSVVFCAAPQQDCIPVTVDGPDQVERSWSGCVQLAQTEAERLQGLQNRDPLLPDQGLLLVFSVEDDLCIHNTGVSFAIDAVFLDQELQVNEVVRDLPAYETQSFCVPNSRFVLEISAGQAKDIQPGDLLNTDLIF